MPFAQPAGKSLILPEGNPNIPGYDSMVFGTDLPPELAAYGYAAAIVMYHAAWDASSTKAQVKYYYIAVYHQTVNSATPSAVDIGAVWCTNPAQNSTGFVVLMMNMFHNGGTNTLDYSILQGGALPNSVINVGKRILLDADTGVWQFRGGDLAYGRRGLINFANGYYNNTANSWGWVQKTPDGTIFLQAQFGTPASGIASLQKICELPFNTYIPKNTMIVPARCGGGVSGVQIATNGQILLDTDGAVLPRASSYLQVNTSWTTLPG